MCTQMGPKSLPAALKAVPALNYSPAHRPHPQSMQHERQCGWAEGSLLEHVTQGTVVEEGKIFGTAAEITTCISMEITREFEQGAEEQ